MESFDVMRVVYVFVPMILSLTVHEYFHAWLSSKLGDDTAVQFGRLTLNPLAHIDPVGTVLIPLVGLLSSVPFFGWAKPVPVNPMRFRRGMRMKTGLMLVSAAGPLSNLLFAILMALLLGAIAKIVGSQELLQQLVNEQGFMVALVKLVGWMVIINVGLFVFNLLPVPPLDGSGVLAGLLPDRYQGLLENLGRYSFVLFIGILLLGGQFIGYPVMWIVQGLSELVGFSILYVAF